MDYAAATPVKEEIVERMLPYFNEHFGNPSAVHKEGQIARNAIEHAREKLARTLHIREDGITFTGSGTEANNLAIYGLLRELTETKGRSFKDVEIITTGIEHASVLEVMEHLGLHGVKVHTCKVTEEGRIDQKQLSGLLSEKTALLSIAYVNSEIGTVEDVKHITRMVRLFNQEHSIDIKVHLDAAQAPLWLPLDMDMLGVDLMSLDAGKCYGPKGVGVLAMRHGVHLKGITLGGGQEGGLRAGTENTPLIVGCTEAILQAQSKWEEKSEAVKELRDHMISLILKEIPEAVLNGTKEYRVANNINISIPGVDSEFAVVTLDANGSAASTKSACGGASGGGSGVVKEVTGDSGRANSTIRFSLGYETTKEEIEFVVRVLKQHVSKMQAFNKN